MNLEGLTEEKTIELVCKYMLCWLGANPHVENEFTAAARKFLEKNQAPATDPVTSPAFPGAPLPHNSQPISQSIMVASVPHSLKRKGPPLQPTEDLTVKRPMLVQEPTTTDRPPNMTMPQISKHNNTPASGQAHYVTMTDFYRATGQEQEFKNTVVRHLDIYLSEHNLTLQGLTDDQMKAAKKTIQSQLEKTYKNIDRPNLLISIATILNGRFALSKASEDHESFNALSSEAPKAPKPGCVATLSSEDHALLTKMVKEVFCQKLLTERGLTLEQLKELSSCDKDEIRKEIFMLVLDEVWKKFPQLYLTNIRSVMLPIVTKMCKPSTTNPTQTTPQLHQPSAPPLPANMAPNIGMSATIQRTFLTSQATPSTSRATYATLEDWAKVHNQNADLAAEAHIRDKRNLTGLSLATTEKLVHQYCNKLIANSRDLNDLLKNAIDFVIESAPPATDPVTPSGAPGTLFPHNSQLISRP
jgi:hypothetical protein